MTTPEPEPTRAGLPTERLHGAADLEQAILEQLAEVLADCAASHVETGEIVIDGDGVHGGRLDVDTLRAACLDRARAIRRDQSRLN